MRIKSSKSDKWIEIKCEGEDDKWIEIKISIGAYQTEGIGKELMKEYAQELGWELEIDKKGSLNEEGIRWYEIKIFPKGGMISPSELLKANLKKYIILILRNMVFANEEGVETAKLSFSERTKEAIFTKKGISDTQINELAKSVELNTSDWKNIIATQSGVLIMKFDLDKAIKLDEKVGGLYTMVLFGVSFKDWKNQSFKDWKNQLNKKAKSPKYWFKNKEEKKKLQKVIKDLEDKGV